MKFNKRLSIEIQELLEKQYIEYVKKTPMTKKEQRALREWVKNGHSVYENTSEIWANSQVPVEFLTVYRDEEYIRKHTKEMNPEEARQFAISYFGFTDLETVYDRFTEDVALTYPESDIDEEIPF